MTYVLFLFGLALLFGGGELLLRGASAIARHFRLSPMVIGLTIVGFGTSAPELLVSLQAALAGQPDMALGSALGSNVSNILLILGFAAMIAPLTMPFTRLWRDFSFMLAASLAIWLMMLDGTVGRLDGLLLLAGLGVFLFTTLRIGKTETAASAGARPIALPVAIALTLAGLVTLVFGARFLVESATEIARAFGISEAVIGLTVVAVGTSLPELATSLIAALRRQTDIAVGNVVGSNIFNILGIVGTTALVTPIPAAPRFAAQDMLWVMGAALALVAISFFLRGAGRNTGVALIVAYAAYVVLSA